MTVVLRRDEFKAQHAAVWGGYDWPAGELLVVKHPTESGVFRTAARADPADAGALWAGIERVASRGVSTYLEAHSSSESLSGLPCHKTGTGKLKRSVAALILDLDTVDGEHANPDQPTRDQALSWISEVPISPSSVVDSGGGFHCTWNLDTLLDAQAADTKMLTLRWQEYWRRVSSRDRLNVDLDFIAQKTSGLRPAGTWSSKAGGRPVRLIAADAHRWPLERLDETLPKLPRRSDRRLTAGHVATVAPGFIRPGSFGAVFSASVAPQVLLERVLNGEPADAEGRWALPLAGGELSENSTAVHVGDDGVERVTFFSSTVQAGLGLASAHPLRSFELLSHLLRGPAAATQLVERYADRWGEAEFYSAVIDAVRPEVAEAFDLDVDVATTGTDAAESPSLETDEDLAREDRNTIDRLLGRPTTPTVDPVVPLVDAAAGLLKLATAPNPPPQAGTQKHDRRVLQFSSSSVFDPDRAMLDAEAPAYHLAVQLTYAIVTLCARHKVDLVLARAANGEVEVFTPGLDREVVWTVDNLGVLVGRVAKFATFSSGRVEPANCPEDVIPILLHELQILLAQLCAVHDLAA